MKIIADNVIQTGDVTLTGTEDTNYPLSNIYDKNVNKVAKLTPAGDFVTLEMTLEYISDFAIINTDAYRAYITIVDNMTGQTIADNDEIIFDILYTLQDQYNTKTYRSKIYNYSLDGWYKNVTITLKIQKEVTTEPVTIGYLFAGAAYQIGSALTSTSDDAAANDVTLDFQDGGMKVYARQARKNKTFSLGLSRDEAYQLYNFAIDHRSEPVVVVGSENSYYYQHLRYGYIEVPKPLALWHQTVTLKVKEA